MNRRQRAPKGISVLVVVCVTAALALPVAAAGLPRMLIWEEALNGNDDLRLRWPVAVATATEGEFAVADAFEPRVIVFKKTGLAWQVAGSTSLPGPPISMTHDGKRYVVAMRGDHGLIAIEGEQLLHRRVGLPRGVVPGPLAARPDGDLMVYDFAGRRILRLRRDGGVAGEIAIDGQVTALATTPGGAFYAAIGQDASILRFNANGELTARWEVPGVEPTPAWPSAITAIAGQGVAVVDRHGGRVVFLDDVGNAVGVGARPGREPGLLKYPAGIDRFPDGRLAIVDGGNGRVQIFRRNESGAVK